ncbi:MAG: diphosphomevalonate decarboxylase [Anaerolineae bacterium]
MKSTAVAGANIALIKYWGNRDEALRLPMNGSIALTLDRLTTITTVSFDGDLERDVIHLDGVEPHHEANARVVAHLDRIRRLAGQERGARVISRSNFPSGAGLAASASGFAALTLAATSALGLDLEERELTSLARLGSGSAARSMLGGFVEWVAGSRHEDSYAYQLAPPDHWALCDCVAVVGETRKPVGSADGHRLAATSPLHAARVRQAEADIEPMRRAIQARDLPELGSLMERDALSMHGVMMTSDPSLLYWMPGTVAVMAAVRRWRAEGPGAWFTIDAGPNVHVFVSEDEADEAAGRLRRIEGVRRVIQARPGERARLSDEHLA